MKRATARSFFAKALAVVLLCGAPVFAFAEVHQTGGEVPLLVSTDWLAENLNRPGLRIVDAARPTLEYRRGHVPGAVHVDRSVFFREVDGVPGMMPDAQATAQRLAAAGIGTEHTVVIYDAANALWSTRLFWTLEYLGHTDVHVLDGGWKKWDAENREIGTEVPDPRPVEFRLNVREELLATQAWVLEHYDSEDVQVVDTRSRGEYTGESARAQRGGHIPGSVHAEWVLNVDDPAQGTFLPKQELREMYDTLGVTDNVEAVTLCQTGVRGSHTYFVLRLLGYENVRLYDGSWVEWGNDPDTPIASSEAN
jgi:thiosulfate/3-mercaptopyruvate sulfurtransferase